MQHGLRTWANLTFDFCTHPRHLFTLICSAKQTAESNHLGCFGQQHHDVLASAKESKRSHRRLPCVPHTRQPNWRGDRQELSQFGGDPHSLRTAELTWV